MILITGLKKLHVSGIALYPFVLIKEKNPAERLVFHERIHIRQQLEMGIFLFYIWYLLEWFVHYLQVKDIRKAYALISFEKEAYAMDKNLDYLNKRDFWAFTKWL
ncbi:hypothetical protein [Jiulongibacter sp. NS-SX5]|uniref:hypothetical protein n=1 Tax=Jiulongibacter sp. NS-SX5 TaxID=3463854 RepID=UPI004059561E